MVPASTGKAREEVSAMQKLIGTEVTLQPWDWKCYSEQVLKAQYDINEDEVKPDFELDHVLNALLRHKPTNEQQAIFAPLIFWSFGSVSKGRERRQLHQFALAGSVSREQIQNAVAVGRDTLDRAEPA